MGENAKLSRLKNRYKTLTEQLANTGLIVQGTVTERTIVSESDRELTYGPYYQWTRKIRQKTVTVNLTRSQAKIFRQAIENNRKMEKIIKEMRSLSIKILDAETEGVKKRKTKQNQSIIS